ncbi:DUF1524 domain-containing protein, partial [Candidatus Saccharibacteria bacterium]|nr:DUF1524 domain-containing protein [Candidatus Saccharibacteria bacterium]
EYEKSEIAMTRELALNESWGLKQIDERNEKLAKQATRLWSLA